MNTPTKRLTLLTLIAVLSCCAAVPLPSLFNATLPWVEPWLQNRPQFPVGPRPRVSAEPSPEADSTIPPEPTTSPDPNGTNGPRTTPEAVDSSEVCVDARYLSYVPSLHLVHKEPILARVLCPQNTTLPCGTPNHMLRIRETATSYASFCLSVPCTHRRIAVNSVLSHRWHEEDHGYGITLTMLDMRHPELIQQVLHSAIAAFRSFRPPRDPWCNTG